MSNSNVHSYSRLRSGDSQFSKARSSQHRSVNRYSPYTRSSHLSPSHAHQRFGSPPSPPPAPTSGSKSSAYNRIRQVGDCDATSHDVAPFSKSHKRFDGLVGEQECPGCPVHPPSTRNNNWLEPPVPQHRSRYRSYEGHEEEEMTSPFRLHSPPPRQQPSVKPNLMSLHKRMDHFDQVLTKLAKDVSEIKRRSSYDSTPAPQPTRNTNHLATEAPPPPQTSELDRLDRMMDQLHFLKNRNSPARANYRYSPERRSDGHYGGH